jgi:outer membrane usher protein
VVLKLILNTEDKGEFFVLLTPENDIWIKREDLEGLGLKPGIGRDVQFEEETYVSLLSIPDLEFKIIEKEASLVINAAPYLFQQQDIDISYKRPYKVVFTEDRSAFLNYAFTYDYRTQNSYFNISSEVGIAIGNYLGLSTFTYEKTKETEDAVRLITNLTFNDRKKLRTLILGDFSASSGALGTSPVMGGINFSKNFSIDPYLLQYPSLNLSGLLETPSEVEVYLNDMLIRRERLSPGRFIFHDVPATVGFGNAKILIRDAYGREKIISTPYYYTTHLLKKGLHEYSYSIGFLREGFGTESFNYGDLAFLSFHNFGFSDNIKLGYSSELSRDLINIGPSASILFLNAGVIDSAVVLSNFRGRVGIGGFLSYSFQSKKINARLSLRSSSRKYSNLALKPSDDKAKFQISGVIGIGGKRTGFITAEYSTSDMYETVTTSRAAISYNLPLTKRTTFFITASEIKDEETTDELFLGLHVFLGRDISSNLSYMSSDDYEYKRTTIHKNLPLGIGFGYRAELEERDGFDSIDASLQYQNKRGIYEIGYSNKTKDMGYKLSLSGGIGYIDNSMFLSRPINDSFAKVKVGGLENVRVYYYGNEVGKTDKDGSLIIPEIRSFHDNRIDIENRDIPIDYRVASLTQYISPPYRSGSVVEFDIQKIQGITGTIYILEEGQEKVIESALIIIETKDRIIKGLVGKEGEFYIENVPSGRHHARLIYSGKECRFDIIIPESDEIFIDTGKIICEVR